MTNHITSVIFQILIILIFAPLLNGIIKKIKSASQHRIGAPVLQLYYDVFKLFKKDMVVSEASSWIFRSTPYIYFMTAIAAFLLVPVLPGMIPAGIPGDAILAIYLLALGRFFIVLSSLDTGSTFGGMGSSREMMVSSLIEPAVLVCIFTLGLRPETASTSFAAIFNTSASLGVGVINPVHMLLMAAMLIVLIAETARIPVDDPATHLELTMIHEAMILEYSGRHLALIEYASSLKQLFFITIIANTFLPFSTPLDGVAGIAAAFVIYILKVLFVTIGVALIEINSVKLRLFSVPNLAALSFILSILGFMSGYLFGR